MDEVNRRNAIKLAAASAVGAGIFSTTTVNAAATRAPDKYEEATVEQVDTSKHGTVALRIKDQPTAHFCDFANNHVALAMAVIAGIQGWKVDFETSGVRNEFWQAVQITKVHKK